MERKKIIRAWRDPAYRERLSPEERMALPPNPAGELDEEELKLATFMGGVTFTGGCASAGCSKIVCTDSCTNKCTDGPACPTPRTLCPDCPVE